MIFTQIVKYENHVDGFKDDDDDGGADDAT